MFFEVMSKKIVSWASARWLERELIHCEKIYILHAFRSCCLGAYSY